MANYVTLKTAVQIAIKTNNDNEITGKILQQQLLTMINSLGSGYQLAGILRPSDTPKTDDQRIAYLAVEPGMYEHAGGFEVAELSLLMYNTAWEVHPLGVPFGSQIAADITAAIEDEKAARTMAILAEQKAREQADNALGTRVTNIEDKIPVQASSKNKLADKDFVNSSIATSTATFRGTFETLEALKATQADKNDYAFWVHKDKDGNTCYDKYTFTETWEFEYTLNNSSFTAAQWAALNSGVTANVIKALQDADKANAKAIEDEKAETDRKVAALQSLLDSMFERVYDSDNKLIRVHSNVTISSSGDIVAGGDSGGGTPSGGAYTQLEWNTIKALTQSESGLLASAYSVKEAYNELNTAIETLAGKATNVKFTQTLTSGTKIGSITIDGKSTNIYAPTPPTEVSQLTNDSGYITGITKAMVEGVLTGNITSHTHTFASLTDKPTTISGYGITDAYTKTETDSKVAALQSLLDSMFERVYDSNNKLIRIHSNVTISSSGDLVAGDNSEGGGTSGGAYTQLEWNAIKALTQSESGLLASAYAVKEAYNELNTAIETLAGKATNVKFTQTLTSGKQIGSISIDGKSTSLFAPANYAWSEVTGKPSFATVATSGSYSDLTNKPTIASLMGSAAIGGESAYPYWNGSAWATKALGSNAFTSISKVSQLTNDSGYITGITKPMVEGVLTGNITSHTHSYLPLSGGTITGYLTLKHSSSDTTSPLIIDTNSTVEVGQYFRMSGTNKGWIGYNPKYGMYLYTYTGPHKLGLKDDGIGYIDSNTILHSGNYNSYAPTLTGTGASGTWGISISGNAATATKATQDGNGKVIAGTYLPLSGGTIHGTQTGPFNINTSATEEVGMRFFMSGSAKAWVGYAPDIGVYLYAYSNHKLGFTDAGVGFLDSNTLIHSGNYNSYAPTLTGTGASGTWGINISGNAATATTATNATTANKLLMLENIAANTRGDLDRYYNLYTGIWTKADLGYASQYGQFIDLSGGTTWYHRLAFNTTGVIEHFQGINTTTLTKVGDLAYTSSNVASATQLANSRTIWGQSFDGTGNVSGNMTGVGSITPTTDNSHDIGTSSNQFRWVYAQGLFAKAGSVLRLGANNTDHMRIITNGNVGIGIDNPQYKLHIGGTAYATENIIAAGDLTAGSDIRYKDKIQDLRLSVHDIALAPAFTYKWNNREDALAHIGSSAQYWLNTDAKDAVYYDKQNDFYHLNYASLALCNTIILARGMETQEEKIARLETRINELEDKLRQYDTNR